MPATELLPKAKEAAQKAVEIDDSLADAHAELGFIIFWYDWDWVAAENQFNRDLEIDPNSADTHLFSREMLALVFRDNGYTVILAEDGLRGLEMARVERPSLIITDINMPGMDAR